MMGGTLTLDETLYFCTDANFNVTAVVDTSGALVERYAYDPYGKVTVLDADWSDDDNGLSDLDNRTLYAGYHFDSETGLYLARNRYYHPTLGRWGQRDPARYVDGMNLYQYVQSAAAVSPPGTHVACFTLPLPPLCGTIICVWWTWRCSASTSDREGKRRGRADATASDTDGPGGVGLGAGCLR